MTKNGIDVCYIKNIIKEIIMQNINLIEKYDLVQDSKFNTRVLAWLLNPYADL